MITESDVSALFGLLFRFLQMHAFVSEPMQAVYVRVLANNSSVSAVDAAVTYDGKGQEGVERGEGGGGRGGIPGE